MSAVNTDYVRTCRFFLIIYIYIYIQVATALLVAGSTLTQSAATMYRHINMNVANAHYHSLLSDIFHF